MELQESKTIITDSKNICLIPAEEPEAVTSALALFYTLKELNKNVNLIIENIPDLIPQNYADFIEHSRQIRNSERSRAVPNLKFLTPSLDFISYPKNFVISIPNRAANISQISYEKSDEDVKIFLTLESGKVKKDDISFYFSETKPDLVVTIGIKDYSEQLKNKLNSFGFLLDSPILNIDSSALTKGERVDSENTMAAEASSQAIESEPGETDTLISSVQKNKKFGKINLIKNSSLPEIVFELIKIVGGDLIKKEVAVCLLAGIVIYTENFKNKITADIFEIAGGLMKKGANLKEITGNLKI